jgi:glucokinase
MYYIGVDIGGTTIKVGLVNDTGSIVDQVRIPTVIDDLERMVFDLTSAVRDYQKNNQIKAVGMGVPGLRNARTHRIVTSPNIPSLTNVSLEKLVADEVHIPVISENDANAAAYAEFVAGFGTGLQHMAYLTLGTGLGSGIILNGRLFGGASGYAVEFGHTVVQPDGRKCPCGSRGCLETLVSGPGIVLTARELMKDDPQSLLHRVPEPLTSEQIFEAAGAGDRVAQATFQRTGAWLGIACTNLINMLNLELIVLGGGVMAAGALLMIPLLAEVQQSALAPSLEDCRIVQSKVWPEAGMIGAAMLARDRHIAV